MCCCRGYCLGCCLRYCLSHGPALLPGLLLSHVPLLPAVVLPQMGLKLSDLRAVSLPMPSARQWVLLLEEEMYGQVRTGGARGGRDPYLGRRTRGCMCRWTWGHV